MGGHALLAAAHQAEAEQPFMQGNVASLENRADSDGEILAAFLRGASVHAFALGLVAADVAAMWAIGAIGPAEVFEIASCGVLVMEMGGG